MYDPAGMKHLKVVDGSTATNDKRVDYSGQFLYEDNDLKCIFTSAGRIVPVNVDGSVLYKFEYNLNDHASRASAQVLGNTRVSFGGHSNGNPEIMQVTDYYPFGMIMAQQNFVGAENALQNKYLYNGKELQDDNLAGAKLDWYDYGARFYDPAIGRFHTQDRFAEKYHSQSLYQYALNNPIKYIDINGDSTDVYILDQEKRPQDNGTKGKSYTANVYVVDENGDINGPFRGSSYPNSVSGTDNTAAANTLSEGTHQYNNTSGHKGGTKKGLNVDDSGTGARTASGTKPDNTETQMEYVNVHSGTSDNGNATSRGSLGCQTIAPTDAASFFSIFDWSGKSGNTGNTVGTISVVRNNGQSASMSASFEQRKISQQQNLMAPLQPLKPRAIISVSQ